MFLTKVTARTAECVTNPDALCFAVALRDRFLLAVLEGDQAKLSSILKILSRATMDREILKVTGLGHLLKDRSLWKASGAYDYQLASTLR